MADFKRRIRIEGGLTETRGYMMIVCDADTGEMIKGVTSILVYLIAGEMNQAEVSYEHITNPEIAVTAYERLYKQSESERLAQLFQETYKRLAPAHGYHASGARALPWSQIDERQKRLMTAVATEVLIAMNGDPHLNLEDYITKPLSIEEQMAPMYEVEEPWPHVVDDGRGGHLVHRENEL